eukprot:3517835-Prymnesium_polylepis.1
MRRIKTLWEDAEHRLLIVQSELLMSKVSQRTLQADVSFMEAQAEQAARENAALREQLLHEEQRQMDTQDALEKALASERQERLVAVELQLQLGQALATGRALTTEVGTIEAELQETEREAEELLRS